jgi:hypothetical protein
MTEGEIIRRTSDELPISTPLTPFIDLASAATLVGLSKRSLLKRIYASGGKKIWAICGRLPGKAPRFDRLKFCLWWQSGSVRSPVRSKRKS